MHPVIKQDLARIADEIKEEARQLSGKTMLLSGGAGFLGSYIVGTLSVLNKNYFKKPCKIYVVDNFITGSEDSFIFALKDPNIRFIQADITKPLGLKEKVHYIIHAAGLASPFYYKKYPIETIDAAILGTRNLLEFARKNPVKSFLFFSSSEIYGDPDSRFIPTPEHYKGNVSSLGPRACYDESKRLSETLCTVYNSVYKIPVKIVRPFNVYGPGMKFDDYRVIPTFLTKALRGEFLPVHGSGNQTRTFCYVSDAVTGFLKVLLSGRNGEVYNVGTDHPEVNIVILAYMVSGLFKNQIEVKLIPYPKSYPQDEPTRRCPDISKIKREVGYFPRIELTTGLRRTLRWFRDKQKRS